MTIKENFLATIKGEKAERYVNQYEYMALIFDPVLWNISGLPFTMTPGETITDGWGVTVTFREDAPGPIPLHNDELTVIKDVTEWRNVVKAPEFDLPDESWAEAVKQAEAVDRNEYMLGCFMAPGIFERVHYLMGMEEAFIAFYEEPEAVHDLIDFLTDWEIKVLEEKIRHLKPDLLFHHDDWGSNISSFLSPEMFDEFITPAYKKVYGIAKEHGLIIVHHSDSYCANLIPSMIEMGIDVWQGCLYTNNVPELIKKYGGQISFQGSIDSTRVDHPKWSEEEIRKVVEEECRANGTKYFIPSITQGGPGSIFPGVYESIAKEIDRMSSILF